MKLEFSQLDIMGHNYMHWRVDIEIYLVSKDLLDTLSEENTLSSIDRQNR